LTQPFLISYCWVEAFLTMNSESPQCSRRSFLLAGTALPAAGFAFSQATPASASVLTAGTVLERIKANVGIPWQEKTVDRLIAGNPDTPVKGIATTMMATLAVCRRAQATGKNMVITHESTFFSHQDTVDQLTQNKTYRYKLDFLTRNNMAVFHFHDHWHQRQPDGIAAGMVRELGWEKNVEGGNLKTLRFSGIPLARFAQDIEGKLGIRTMRVLGDPQLPVNRVATSWGYLGAGIELISREDVDVLVCGETREWELVEFVQDMISSGQKKALVMLGHVVSEQAGMKLCAEWLRSFIGEVPVEFIAAPEPFWSPRNPVA
jgi:putative NIF3 family GTP cyclohydrolase 1 type 2